jgi:type IV pilus biogenesis protein CpaD/CtpE
MSWITLTEAGVQTKLAGAELAALKSAALASGQSNPLPEVITQVTREVRGYVAACARNVLGEEGTIPDELELAALNRIRYELATRLPVASLLTEARKDANRGATEQLKDAAACRFLIVAPATAATAQAASGSAAQVVTKSTRQASRDKLSGL